MNLTKMFKWLSCGVVTLTLAPIASAQLEEVVVTAQKREQTRMEVPVSLQAIDGDSLSNFNVRDSGALIPFIPGAGEGEQLGVSQKRFQIRGVSQLAGDPTIGYYIGDAPFFRPGQLWAPVVRTVGLERVEVLKGPQSTLWGNGAMGGVIRFIPLAPNLEEFEFSLRGGIGSIEDGDSTYSVDATVSLPVVQDKLALRFSASQQEIGGWQQSLSGQREVGEDEMSDYRLQLLAQPSDRMTLKFMAIANETNTSPGSLLVSTNPPVNYSGFVDAAFSDAEYDLYSGTLVYDFDTFTLTSTTSYLDYEDVTSASPLFFGFPFQFSIGEEAETFSNETRLASNGEAALDWMVGVFYTDADREGFISSFFLETVDASSESISVFGELSRDFLDGKLTPLIGLRYFEDDRSRNSNAPGSMPQSDSYSSVNPRFNLSYRPDEESMFYANVAKGFRSGTFNSPLTCLQQELINPALDCRQSIDSDEVWNYELGTKQTYQDGQLLLDLAFYYTDWTDAQVQLRVGGLTAEYAAGDIEAYGFDFQVSYAPSAVDGLVIGLSGNWNSTEYKSLDPVLDAALTKLDRGDRVASVPEWSSSATVTYTADLSGGWLGSVFVSYNHIEGMPGSTGSIADGEARDLVSVRFGVKYRGFGIYLVGDNMLDEDAVVFAQDGPGFITGFSRDLPRRYGIELTYDY